MLIAVLIAIPFLVIIGAMVLVIIVAYSATLIRMPLEQAAEKIPVVGRYLRSAQLRLGNAIVGTIERWTRPLVEPLANFFTGIAQNIRELADEMAAFTTRTKSALAYIATELIPAKIRAITRPLAETATEALDGVRTLGQELGQFRTGIEARVRQLTAQVWERAIEPLAALRLDFTRFRAGIEGRVRQLTEQVWERAIQPIAGVIDIELPRIRIDVGDLRKLLDDARAWIVPIASVFTAAAVVALLRHVAQCRPKTERLCRLDTDDLDELLGLTFSIVALAELLAVIRTTAQGMDEIVGPITPSIRR